MDLLDVFYKPRLCWSITIFSICSSLALHALSQPLICSHCSRLCQNVTCPHDGHVCDTQWPDLSSMEFYSSHPKNDRRPALVVMTQFSVSSENMASLAEDVFLGGQNCQLAPIPVTQPDIHQIPRTQLNPVQKASVSRPGYALSWEQSKKFLEENLTCPSDLNHSREFLAVHRRRHQAWTFINLLYVAPNVFYIWLDGQEQALSFSSHPHFLEYLIELVHSLEVSDIFHYVAFASPTPHPTTPHTTTSPQIFFSITLPDFLRLYLPPR